MLEIQALEFVPERIGSALAIGVGDGRDCHLVARKGIRVQKWVVIEPEPPEILQVNLASCPSTAVVPVLVQKDSFPGIVPEQKFDLVIAFGDTLSLSGQDPKTFLTAVGRLLTPRGFFLFSYARKPASRSPLAVKSQMFEDYSSQLFQGKVALGQIDAAFMNQTGLRLVRSWSVDVGTDLLREVAVASSLADIVV